MLFAATFKNIMGTCNSPELSIINNFRGDSIGYCLISLLLDIAEQAAEQADDLHTGRD